MKGLASFCAVMDMPCISTHAYNKQVKVILEVLEDEADKQVKKCWPKDSPTDCERE